MLLEDRPWGYSAPMSSDPGFYSALSTPAFCGERLVLVGAGHSSILGQVTTRLHIWSTP
jgi:hypothetical protein